MIKKPVFVAFILLGLGCAILYAADFWQKKKFTEWTQKEAQEMMSNSPWARRTEVIIRGSKSGGGVLREGRAGGRPPGVGIDRQGSGGNTGSDTTSEAPRTALTIRFHAALPFKQALARMRYGDGVLRSPEAAQMLSRKEDAYLIGILGPTHAFAGNPDTIRENAVLLVRGRDPIHAASVSSDVDKAAGTMILYLAFPRNPNPIRVEDESIEFQLKLPSFELKHRFKLKDMIFEGNLEL